MKEWLDLASTLGLRVFKCKGSIICTTCPNSSKHEMRENKPLTQSLAHDN